MDYWKQVDLYVGGSEHATGHLLYVRFWTKFLFDRGHIAVEEPAQKLVNQGMIQGVSAYAGALIIHPADVAIGPEEAADQVQLPHILISAELYDEWTDRSKGFPNPASVFINKKLEELAELLCKKYGLGSLQFLVPENGPFNKRNLIVPVSILAADSNGRVSSDEVRIDKHALSDWRSDFKDAFYISRSDEFKGQRAVDKMSKSKWNVENPDDIIEKYGADTLRLYEMFLGPLEQSKPWDTNGIEGTSRFLKKFWNLFFESDILSVSDVAATKAELKVLHATLKKVTEDIEKLSFNTSVSQFMIAVNELGSLKCHKRDVLEPLTIALAPFAPHIAEELWSLLGQTDSITTAPWPQWQAEHLVEDSFSYPISFNGKTRLQLEFPMELDAKSVEAAVLANPEVQARLEGKLPKKVIVVPKRIVNIVV